MGTVLLTGLSIGTLFTLFVVPAVYMFIGADHGHEGHGAIDAQPLPPAPAHG
jgi:multidrug efflux pump